MVLGHLTGATGQQLAIRPRRVVQLVLAHNDHPKIIPHFCAWRGLNLAEEPGSHVETIYRWEFGNCRTVIDMVHAGEGGQGGICACTTQCTAPKSANFRGIGGKDNKNDEHEWHYTHSSRKCV